MMLLIVVSLSGSDGGIFSCEDTGDPGSDFVVDDGFVVFPDDVNAEFLT